MAKNRIPQKSTDNSRDYLRRQKSDFENELLERIKKGEELLARSLNNTLELSQLNSDYSFWHDYNKELLKKAFDKETSQYFRDYSATPSVGISYGFHSSPTFVDSVNKTKGLISTYLTRLKKLKQKLVLIDEIPGAQFIESIPNKHKEGITFLKKLFSKFHKTAQNLRHRHNNRETLILKDEYDVQDLLRGLLAIEFEDIREEEYSPSNAGGNSRIDFVLKNENIVIETKMTNDHLKDKEIGAQLLIDIGRYREHPNCETLVVFVYDKGDHIRNKLGLINDLEKMSTTNMAIKIFIEPK